MSRARHVVHRQTLYALVMAIVAIGTVVAGARAQLQGGGDLDPDLPPALASEAREGIAAEQLLFQAANVAYPSQYNISFSYRLIQTAAGPDTKSYHHSVLWSVQFHEANPLAVSATVGGAGFIWDLTSIPTDILYDRTLHCAQSVLCEKCNKN